MSYLIAEVEVAFEPGQLPERGIRHARARRRSAKQAGRTWWTDAGSWLTEKQLGPNSEATLRDLSEALITVYRRCGLLQTLRSNSTRKLRRII